MYKTQSLSENRVGFEGSASELMECSHTTACGAGMAGTYLEDTVPVFFMTLFLRIFRLRVSC